MKGKICVVTGGGSGIGEAMSIAFAQKGCHVVILELNEESANNVKEGIISNGGLCSVFTCNVGNHQAMLDVFERIKVNVGEVGILINNAGIAHVGTLETTSEEDLDLIYQVNIKGVYNGMFAALPQLKNTRGIILNLSSIASTIGLPDRFAYSMSKAAVENMTYTVARDYIDAGIRCNCMSPARVHTPFVDKFIAKNYPGQEKEMFEKLSKTQPIGRMGKPEEIAALAVFLCSDQASFITGSNFPIDGGFIKLNT